MQPVFFTLKTNLQSVRAFTLVDGHETFCFSSRRGPSLQNICLLVSPVHLPPHHLSLCLLLEQLISIKRLLLILESFLQTTPSRGERLHWATKKNSESRYDIRSTRYHLIAITTPLAFIYNNWLHKWVKTVCDQKVFWAVCFPVLLTVNWMFLEAEEAQCLTC